MAVGGGGLGVGERIGAWTVLFGPLIRGHDTKLLCRCDCGTEREVSAYSLKAGSSTRCRKCSNRNNEKARVARRRPLSAGDVFGAWTVVSEEGVRDGGLYFLCRCQCGAEAVLGASHLRAGQTTKCVTCQAAARVRHGEGGSGGGVGRSTEYAAWVAMLQRCQSDPDWAGRGIVVCAEWQGTGGYERFLAHVGRRPSPEHSLDRIDNNGNYEPGNVRWATRRQQAQNKRTTRLIKIGDEEKCIAEWARAGCLNAETLRRRLNRGWDPERAVFGKVGS